MANPFLKNIDLLNISQLLYKSDEEFANKMDLEDPLNKFRGRFHFPKMEDGTETIYLCGNSLGLQSKLATSAVDMVMDQWRSLAVKGHFDNDNPWTSFHLSLKSSMAELVGAKPDEVTLMNTLTVNLHLMLTSFYQPKGRRTKILMEKDAFPSDRYAVESHLHWHGLSIEENIIYIYKEKGRHYIDQEEIKKIIEDQGEEIALIMIGGVNYYTGQCFNLPKIVEWGHSQGCIVGFDLAHAVGNVPLSLHDSGADFAVWCTYKYMNSGPGSIAGAYVHERYHSDDRLPKLKGWWGHDADIRFKMRDDFLPAPGIESWQISCQPILSLAPVKASLEMFAEAGMKALRNKSVLLTGYLEYLLKELSVSKIKILTPELQSERGCQLSIFIEGSDKSVHDQLSDAGVITDWRNPGVIRVAPAPLYNSYMDVYRFVKILSAIID